jgi:hypothetical protein
MSWRARNRNLVHQGIDVEMLMYGRAMKSQSVIRKNKIFCNNIWIISCTPPWVVVTRTTCLMQRQVVRQPQAWRSNSHPGWFDRLQEPCCIVAMCAACYHGGRGCRRRASACTHCCSAVRTPSTCTKHTTTTLRCSTCCWQRTVSSHRWQAGTSNMLLHGDMKVTKAIRSIGYVANQGRCPQWSWDRSPREQRVSKATEDFYDQNLIRCHVWRINHV